MDQADKPLREEARRWLFECFSDEYDHETIQELTYYELITLVNKYYDGGMKSFISTVLEQAQIDWDMVQ